MSVNHPSALFSFKIKVSDKKGANNEKIIFP